MKPSGEQAKGARATSTRSTTTARPAAPAAPAAPDPTGLLELQRVVGNRAVRSLLSSPGVVQRRAIPGASASATPQATAARGTDGSGGPLPYLSQIQASFGRHDVSRVRAFRGRTAAEAAGALGAQAFAYGDRVAFASRPDLRTAAHEAAHVVQQRKGIHPAGGIDRPGDRHEQHADAVADAVVAGGSAERLLDALGGGRSTAASVQRQPAPGERPGGRPERSHRGVRSMVTASAYGRRLAIWQRIWPAETPLGPDLDLAYLARRFELAGAHLRNIALAAAVLAAAEDRPMNQRHALHAARREYQKLGKMIDESAFGGRT